MIKPSVFALALAASVSLSALAQAAPPPKPAAAPAAKPAAVEDPLTGLNFRLVGPFRGGRVAAVAGVAGDPNTFYFGAAAGGLWKTTDGGTTWKPLWDKFPEAAPAVGAVAVAPSNPKIVYAGTGETNIRGNAVTGNGLYKSTDAGKTWSFSGLRDTQVIGRIVVDPKNPDIVFVAALGHPFADNAERGIFKSVDGGKTWKKVLFVDQKTGGVDVRQDPTDPKVMWAGMWQVHRKPWIMESGGPGSGLFKSVDGGETWTRQSGGGLPEGILGRVNIAPTSDPKRVYAMIEAAKGGLYRTDDGGKTWALISDKNDYRQRAWYFNTTFADPKAPDTVYVLNTSIYRSTDAGKTFKALKVHHGDTHELWIDPTDTKRMIEGDDGGAEITVNGGETWTSEMNQPTAQFYHIAADDRYPFRLFGAQQDNSTIAIPTAGRGGSVGIEDWYPVAGGESGFVVPDPTDPEIVYAGSYDGLITRYDHRTDQTRHITPWPRNIMGWAPKDEKYRFQWTAPIMISRHEPHALYHGAQVLFRSLDQGQSWTAISPDLTRNDKSRQEASGGPLTHDNTSVETYGTIFSVTESPLAKDQIWVGSDDGLAHLTRDGGAHWADVTPKDMPDGATIQTIEPDPRDAGSAWMVADRHRLDDQTPYAWRTTDFGRSWTRIGDGLPGDAYLHVIRADPTRKGLLYAGTERGLWLSYDDGAHWRPFQLNLPVVPVHDLVVHGNSLAIATHGRAFWIMDDLTPVRLAEGGAPAAVKLVPPAPAIHTGFGRGGDGRFASGANPPNGAIITYWLPPSIGTARPAVGEADKDKDHDKDKKKGPDPLDARIKLEILDDQGRLVRAFPEPPVKAESKTEEPEIAEDDEEAPGPKPVKVPHLAGYNTFAWDLRWAGATAVPKAPLWAGSVAGPKALPGHYQVRLTVDGVSQTQPLEILPDPRGLASAADLKAQFDLHSAINAELSAVDSAVLEIRAERARIEAARAAARGRLDPAAAALQARLTAIEEALIQPRAHASEDALNFPIRLNNMLAALASLVAQGDYAPTSQDQAMFVELKGEADAQLAAWAEVKAKDIPAFEKLAAKR